jgi:membrane-bound lytic murein transglycosylase D
MPNRASFALMTGGFLVLLASGRVIPADAEPRIVSLRAPEHGVARAPGEGAAPEAPAEALPSQAAGTESGPLDLLRIERLAEDPEASERLELIALERRAEEAVSAPGSGTGTAVLSRVVVDPWAEAVAEAARSQPPAAPPYQVVINSHVQSFLDRFTGSRRDVVGLWLNRSRRYLDMIRSTLRDHGLPEDLAFVAMIESGFNPLAVSRAGAKGLWQFMAGTARRYGLRVDQWVDERLDPEKSTLAAARYLRDLYAQFGSWALAKAAYNAGEVRIAEAIRKLGSRDFWALARTPLLKPETRDFVPAIHAATVIGREPERWGFTPEEPEPVVTETVAVPPGTSLANLARASGVPFETLRQLNPVLVRGVTPPGAPYRLRVPAAKVAAVRAALAEPRPAVARVHTRRAASVHGTVGRDIHVVRPHDTVGAIARLYGVKVSDVLRWNDLDERARIRPGDRLRVREVRVSAQTASPSAR